MLSCFQPSFAAAPVDPKGDGISFFSGKTRLWQGRSQIICFQVAQPATDDRYYSFQVDEKLVHLLIPPRVLKGEKIGYLRVQAMAEGKTQIGIESAKLDIEIVRDPSLPAIAELKPQIVSPASGAHVWGDFVVGVEQLSLGDPTQLPAPTLLLPNGKQVAGKVVPDQKPGPHARWVFNVSGSDLAPGSNALVAIQKGDAGQDIRSNSIEVDVIAPDAASIQAGLCKDAQTGDRAANDGPNFPKIINDDKYGQGMIIDGSDEGQSWCLPVWLEKKGKYQMVVTARGEFGSDALATIAVTIDEQNQPETTARLATTEWQRIPVGRPFTLEAGGHILSVRIRNGFSRGPDDNRSLFLQKYELACIDKSENNLAANGGDGGSMIMTAMKPANAGGGADDVHITFAENLDRQVVTGAIDVAGECWRPNREHSAPPRVELYANQKLVAAESSDHPHWTIDPAAFTPGLNVLQLKAILPSGAWVKSVPEEVEVPPHFPPPNHIFQPTIVFTSSDSGLASTMVPAEKQDNPEVATFYSNATSTVKIPDDLNGKYRIVIEAKGDNYQGPALISVGLKAGEKETKLGEFPAPPKMGSVQIGQVVLAPGEKELSVGFTNDLYDGKGDRNLYVQSVRLVPIPATPPTSSPVVSIAYAPKECAAEHVDAVVAHVMDSQRVAGVDLVIDDQPQHLDRRPRHGLGPVLFPLLTRDLKPGHHRLRVIAHNDAGIAGISPDISFTVSATPTTVLNKYERALFLLNRFGYGPEPGEVADILTLGEKSWLESRLNGDIASPGEQNEEERLRAQFPDQRDNGQVTLGAVQYLLTEPNPVRARFVMWTENHFSTWLNRDGASAKANEHQSFLQLGPVPFFDLLFTSATSPAMLVYLDQKNSFAHHLNENYAREIMELHTLGVKGGYTQKDVTTLADLLTGWTLNDEAPSNGQGGDLDHVFGFDPRLSSGVACRVLGQEFLGVEPERRFDRVVMALEMLSAHPSCANFISRKLCEQYVSDPAPPKLVADLSQVYLETGGDIPAMLEAMAEHPDFWASTGKVTSTIDFGVRTARMAYSTNPGPVNDLISASGMGMFDRATPDGYPEDNGYNVNSNALIQRWRFAKTIQNDFLNAGLIPDFWRPTDQGWSPEVTQQIVDLASVRMTGNILSQSSNDAAQKLLASAPTSTDVRLHALATLICQLPENSLK